MAVPASKDALLTAIDTEFGKVIRDFRAVPPAQAMDRTLEGHAKDTRMSVADLAAYLIGWNELVLNWLDRDAAGQPIDFPATGFRWNELGRLARKFYSDSQELSYPERLDRLIAAKTRIVALVEARDNDTLYGRPWYGKWTMGRMIQLNTASPYANARGRLRKWRTANSGT